MNPLISIVIPAYNVEKFIYETISSVINQSYTNWELIVIIDGATDNTESIINTFLNDSRITKVVKRNTGVSDTRNIGINLAKGKYVAFLDADDVWLPSNLEKKISVLESNKHIGWVYSNMNEADENMKIKGMAPAGKGVDILNNILSWNGEVVPGPCSNVIVRKEILDKGIRFDSLFSTAADQDFTIQLASVSQGFLIDEPLWNYRVLPNSMSRNIKVMELDHIGVFKKAKKNHLFKSYIYQRICFANLFLILAGSWWVNGKNKKRAIFFLFKSAFMHPLPILKKVLNLI